MGKKFEFVFEVPLKDFEILCKTKLSIIYTSGNIIAKQALIKEDYSINDKLRMILDNIF